MRPRLDPRAMAGRVGLVVLATDHTTETDFARMVAGPGIGVYASRVAYANPVTPANLRAMQPGLAAAAALILPGEALDALVYSCTSASVVIGEATVAAALNAGKPGAPVVTPTAAAVAGLRALGARRISLLTPYTEETAAPMHDYFTAQGFGIDRLTCFGMEDDREMARIAPDEIAAHAVEALDPASDALFVSCTALRAAGVAARIEAATGRPVVTSNLATAWACLRLCGVAPVAGGARLMALDGPGAEGAA
ncbi:MAG: ectoine utilization protein EutA [Gemmobacter sp.]